MTSDGKCLIWGVPAEVQRFGRDYRIESGRSDGAYFVEGWATRKMRELQDDEKAKLTTWIVDQHRLGEEVPTISIGVLDQLSLQRKLSVSERSDRLIRKLAENSSLLGQNIKLSRDDNVAPGELAMSPFIACTESITQKETYFLLDYLESAGRITYDATSSALYLSLTFTGYSHIESLERALVNSNQAFIAMWFNTSMNNFFDSGIEPAVQAAGYEPFRVDRKDHNNKIDDEIIAEIRRSRFLIADFTADYELETFNAKKPEQKGARGGVYYEAGFAHGLGIPVIFTCREDVLERLHFDTRQYNHIAWNPGKLEDFREALENRIAATIGDGPLRSA